MVRLGLVRLGLELGLGLVAESTAADDPLGRGGRGDSVVDKGSGILFGCSCLRCDLDADDLDAD